MLKDSWRTTLSQLEGSSVRVSPSSDQQRHWVGLLGGLDRHRVTVELADLPERVLDGTEVQVEVLHQGGMYQFSALGWSDPVHHYRLQLSIPEQIQAVQRRLHPRVPILGDVVVWAMDGTNLVSRGDARAINISIGGIAFQTGYFLTEKTYLYIQVRGGPARHLGHLEGEVLRTVPYAGGGWHVAMAFRNLPSRTAAEIFEFVQSQIRARTGFLESAAAYID